MTKATRSRSRKLASGVILAALMSLAAALPAGAAEPGDWNVQIYGGWYFAGDLQALEELPGNIGETIEALGLEPGDDLTFGLRGGRRASETWGWEVNLGFFDVDDAAERLETRAGLDVELLLFDVSVIYYPGGGNFFLYGGPGFADSLVRITHEDNEILDESEVNFSANLGLGYIFDLGETTFIRIDGKLRWIDADYYDGNTDGELTLAIGWNF